MHFLFTKYLIFPFQEYIEKAREDKIVFSKQMEKYLSKSKSPVEDLHTEETEAEESEEDEDEEEVVAGGKTSGGKSSQEEEVDEEEQEQFETEEDPEVELNDDEEDDEDDEDEDDRVDEITQFPSMSGPRHAPPTLSQAASKRPAPVSTTSAQAGIAVKHPVAKAVSTYHILHTLLCPHPYTDTCGRPSACVGFIGTNRST